MKQTLIFKTRKDFRSPVNAIITEFVKEGTFQDAMNYFDDQFPVFEREGGGRQWADGGYICTGYELDHCTELTATPDSANCLTYYTVDRDNLGLNELLALSEDMKAKSVGYWEENGFDPEAFYMAFIEDELPILHEMGSEAYLQFRIENA